MGVHVNPHKVTLREHRDGTYTLKGLNVNDLLVLQHAIGLTRDIGITSPGDEWWQDVKAWCTAFRTLVQEAYETSGLPGELEAELPWVDR